MNTVKIIYPNAIDVGCFSHAFDRVGEHFNILTLTEFIGNWLSLFSHSIKAKFLCKQTDRHFNDIIQCYKVVEQMGNI